MRSNSSDVYDVFLGIISSVIFDRDTASKTATMPCNAILNNDTLGSYSKVNLDTLAHTKAQYEQLLRMHDVVTRIGLKKSSIYAKIQQGSFPRPVKIGRATLWRASELDAWIATHQSSD
ncbi:MAG: AlpA family phage regulatory protein [Alphaproteobacteria bacterium]